MPTKEVCVHLTFLQNIKESLLYTVYKFSISGSSRPCHTLTLVVIHVIQVYYTQISTTICMQITNDKIINIYLQELNDLCLVLLKQNVHLTWTELLVQEHHIPDEIWLIWDHRTVLYGTLLASHLLCFLLQSLSYSQGL